MGFGIASVNNRKRPKTSSCKLLYLWLIPLFLLSSCGSGGNDQEDAQNFSDTPAPVAVSSTPVPRSVPAVPAPEPTPKIEDFIINTNSEKFHVPSCNSVGKMKDSNKQEYTGTREELIQRGLDPCDNCHP